MVTIATLLAYALLVLLVAAVVGTSAMAFTLRSRFPDVWRSWGEPVEWIWPTRTSIEHHVFSFLQSRSYRATGNARFILFCELLRAGWYAVLALFPVASLLLVVALVSR